MDDATRQRTGAEDLLLADPPLHGQSVEHLSGLVESGMQILEDVNRWSASVRSFLDSYEARLGVLALGAEDHARAAHITGVERLYGIAGELLELSSAIT